MTNFQNVAYIFNSSIQNKGVYMGGGGAVPLTRPVKGEPPPLERRAITLFKSELKSQEY